MHRDLNVPPKPVRAQLSEKAKMEEMSGGVAKFGPAHAGARGD